jgi:hypothetical protein
MISLIIVLNECPVTAPVAPRAVPNGHRKDVTFRRARPFAEEGHVAARASRSASERKAWVAPAAPARAATVPTLSPPRCEDLASAADARFLPGEGTTEADGCTGSDSVDGPSCPAASSPEPAANTPPPARLEAPECRDDRCRRDPGCRTPGRRVFCGRLCESRPPACKVRRAGAPSPWTPMRLASFCGAG